MRTHQANCVAVYLSVFNVQAINCSPAFKTRLMRLIFFITIIFSLLSQALPAQLINPDLTAWEEVTSSWGVVVNPVGWMTNNEPPFTAVINSPVTLVETNTTSHARLESNFRSIDALGPGWMSQTIPLADLLNINYHAQCDSLADKGYCLVEILIAGSREQLYGDTIRTTSAEFITQTVYVPAAWRERADSITLKFTAYGNLFQLEPEEDAYAIFFVDRAQASYLTDATIITAPRSRLELWPNPARNQISVQGAKLTSFLSVYDLNGRLQQMTMGTGIDVSKLLAGTYVLKVTDGSITRSGKFVKR